MQTKRSKYDTNPLDPDVAKRTEEVWGKDEGASATGEIKGATRPVAQQANESPRSNVHSEAPTRRYDVPPNSSYPSVFVPPTYSPPPEIYQPPPVLSYQTPVGKRPTSRSVEGLGLAEKWAMVLPYTPFYVGVVASIIELILVPRRETRVRAHAAQGLALHMTIIAIEMLFRLVTVITGSAAGGSLFKLGAFTFLVISMIRVWQGKTHRIAPLADLSEWLNKHVEARR
jgi:uncharacterized membrane protein